jgi:hypothetical protein
MEMKQVGGYTLSSEREFRQAYLTLRIDMTADMAKSLNTMVSGGKSILWNRVTMSGNAISDLVGTGLTIWPLLFTGPQTYSYNYHCSNRGCAIGEFNVE